MVAAVDVARRNGRAGSVASAAAGGGMGGEVGGGVEWLACVEMGPAVAGRMGGCG